MDQIRTFSNSNYGFFIVFCVLLSCSGQKTDFPTIIIDPYQGTQRVALSEFADGMEVINLETNLDGLITTFSWIVHIDRYNVIFKSGKSVLIFDREGRFQQRIHALGGGPKEYLTIVSVMVDSFLKEIFIADYRTIKVYSYQGEYLRTLNFPFVISGAFKLPNGNIVIPQRQTYSEVDRTSLTLLDSGLNVIKNIPSRVKTTSEVKQNLFYASDPLQFGNKILYHEPYSDTLFKLDRDSLIPQWAFDLKGREFTIDESINTEKWHYASSVGKIPPFAIRVTPKYFFIDYYFEEGKCLTVVNNEDLLSVFHKYYMNMETDQGIENDLDPRIDTFWPNYSNGKDIIAQYIYPESLSATQLEKLGVKKDDNPILLIAQLKK